MIGSWLATIDAKIRALLGVVDFFVPLDVFLAIFLVFAMENIVETALGDAGIEAWLALYGLGIVGLALSTYLSADEDERAELERDLETLE